MYKLILFTKSNWSPLYSINSTGMLRGLKEHFNLIEISAPGHNIQIDPNEIIEKHNPDVVLCHAHSKHLKGFFNKFKCLKVMIAVDYYKRIIRNDMSFYDSNNFDVTFQRHFYSKKLFNRDNPITSVYLPWSVDDTIFKPNFKNWHNRRRYIGLAANYKSEVYQDRRNAIKELYDSDLIRDNDKTFDFNKQVIVYENKYPGFLRKFIGCLSSCELDSMYNKIIQYIASGCIPLTPEFGKMDLLFPNETLMLYNRDCSDIIDKAQYIINNSDEMFEKAKNLYDHYLNAHTHKIRLKELSDNIINLLEGRSLVRKWDE